MFPLKFRTQLFQNTQKFTTSRNFFKYVLFHLHFKHCFRNALNSAHFGEKNSKKTQILLTFYFIFRKI